MDPLSPRARHNRFPLHTWIGLLAIIGGQILFFLEVRFVAVWLTPIMWTGYILLVDGLVYRSRGQSWLTVRKGEFPFLVLLSVLIWLVFEVYNLRLKNWFYLGVPETAWLRDLAYFWSFATILPGVFETIDLLSAFDDSIRSKASTSLPGIPVGTPAIWFTLGLAMVSIPPLLPENLAVYLFAPVWIGFILLVDPLNQRLGLPSIRLALKAGKWMHLLIILAAGLVCGFLWETWNYQAYLAQGGHWIYTVPDGLRILGLHYGQMPILGLLGFPPFALELVLIYSGLREVMNFDHLIPGQMRADHPLLPRELVEQQ